LQCGEPETLKAVSGARGGYHYVFKHENGDSYKGKLVDGIDVQYNKYILIAPSVVQRPYRWVKKTAAFGVKPLPAWLKPLVLKPVTKRKPKQNPEEFDAEFFKAIGEQLAEKEFGYDDWLNIGMALHYVSGGSDEGFEIYQDITNGINHAPGDDAEIEKKWNGFNDSKSNTPVTGGTFLTIAKNHGCTIDHNFKPMDYFQDETREAPEEKTQPKARPVALKKPDSKKWGIREDREFSDERDEVVTRLNYLGYSVLQGAKEGRIFKAFRDEHGCLDVTELSPQCFKTSVARMSYREILLNNGKNPTTKMHDADNVWTKSRSRKEYKGITFKPNPEKGMLNLWDVNPIPCERVKGNVNLVLQLIEKIMCNGNTEKANYLIQYFAHIMQRPEVKPRVVPIFIGVEGTGKGCLTNGILGGILKSRYTLVDTRDGVKNKFNKDLAYRFLIILDEACWQGDTELQSILRSRTGNKKVSVEEKFGSKYMVDDFARYIITANTADSVKIQESNTRYLIFKNADKYLNHPIYEKIWGAIESDKLCEKFYDYLMDIDLTAYTPHKFPKHLDDEGADTKVGDDIFREYLFDLFEENPRALWYKKGVRCSDMYDDFISFKNIIGTWRKQLSPKLFWSEMNKIAPLTRERKKVMRLGTGPSNSLEITPNELKASFWSTLRLGENTEIENEEIFYYE